MTVSQTTINHFGKFFKVKLDDADAFSDEKKTIERDTWTPVGIFGNTFRFKNKEGRKICLYKNSQLIQL